MAKYKCVTGFKDVYNTEHKIEGYILDIINEVSETYNFKYIDIPEFEQTMLYTDYYGEEIKDSLFTIGSRATSSISLKYRCTALSVYVLATSSRTLATRTGDPSTVFPESSV